MSKTPAIAAAIFTLSAEIRDQCSGQEVSTIAVALADVLARFIAGETLEAAGREERLQFVVSIVRERWAILDRAAARRLM